MNVVAISGLEFGYSGHAPARLAQLDMAVGAGELLGLTGESGAGKTTLLRLVAGELAPRAGAIQWQGQRSVAYAPQADILLEFRTAWQNGALLLEGRSVPGAEIADGLDFLRSAFSQLRLEEQQDRPPAELSGGMRQRVQVAQALARKAALLLLDEPFSEQDFDQQRQMETLIHRRMRANGQAAIIVSHDLSALGALCDRILFLEHRPARTGDAAAPPPPLSGLDPADRRAHADFASFEVELWRRRAGARPT